MPRPRPNRSSRSTNARPGRPGPGGRPGRPSRPARPGKPGRPEPRGPKWSARPTRPNTPHSNPSASKPGGSSRRPRPSDFKPPAERDSALGVRLQRVMADAGVASRRECEQMIADGRVEVNDAIVTELPIFVNPATDRIKVDGQHLPRSDRAARRVYVMLNKPDNTLGTTRDELEYEKGGRRTVTDLVQHPSGARLYPVGRLDFHSTGLVLMTNDGELADRLTHARYGVTKTFRVWVNGAVRPDILEMLRRRIGKRDATDAEGRPTGGVRIVGDDEDRPGRRPGTPSHATRPPRPQSRAASERDGTQTIIEIQVRDGKTDPLDEMLLSVGCRVRRIARTAIGPLKLIGVKPGEWRELTKEELAALKEAAGLTAPRPNHPARPARPRPDRAASPSHSDSAASEPAAPADSTAAEDTHPEEPA